MSYVSTTDQNFLGTLESWFRTQPDILLLVRYSHAAGSKEFELFSSFQSVVDRLGELPPLTGVIAFRQPQLPLRGIVDDGFIAHCLSNIPDSSEYLVLERTRRVYGQMSWFHHGAGISHEELRTELEDSRGVEVAVGLYPPWLEDTDEVVSAVVPDAHGAVKSGIY